jgi:hypothetical protein
MKKGYIYFFTVGYCGQPIINYIIAHQAACLLNNYTILIKAITTKLQVGIIKKKR